MQILRIENLVFMNQHTEICMSLVHLHYEIVLEMVSVNFRITYYRVQ